MKLLIDMNLSPNWVTALAAAGGEAPSVVRLRAANVSAGQTAPALLRALINPADALEAGALLTVDLRRSRIRLLPIPRAGARPEAAASDA